jgi:hypothetical protein
MRYRLDIPEVLGKQLEALPPTVLKGLLGGLHLAAQALGDSAGARAWGERVPDFKPPMYILTSQGHRLLYEVNAAERAILVRSLALPVQEEGSPGGQA